MILPCSHPFHYHVCTTAVGPGTGWLKPSVAECAHCSILSGKRSESLMLSCCPCLMQCCQLIFIASFQTPIATLFQEKLLATNLATLSGVVGDFWRLWCERTYPSCSCQQAAGVNVKLSLSKINHRTNNFICSSKHIKFFFFFYSFFFPSPLTLFLSPAAHYSQMHMASYAN